MADFSIFSEIERYTAERGIAPGTLSSYALGKFQRIERMQRMLEGIARDEARLRRYMAENPPQEPPRAGAA